MNLDYTPTCEELRLQRQLKPKFDNLSRFFFTRYKSGQIVKFKFNNLIRTGRITNVNAHNGLYTYNIETNNGVWHKAVDTEDIISVVNN